MELYLFKACPSFAINDFFRFDLLKEKIHWKNHLYICQQNIDLLLDALFIKRRIQDFIFFFKLINCDNCRLKKYFLLLVVYSGVLRAGVYNAHLQFETVFFYFWNIRCITHTLIFLRGCGTENSKNNCNFFYLPLKKNQRFHS